MAERLRDKWKGRRESSNIIDQRPSEAEQIKQRNLKFKEFKDRAKDLGMTQVTPGKWIKKERFGP